MDELSKVIGDIDKTLKNISLLALSGVIYNADCALREGDLGVAQGTLRKVYNELGGLDSQLKHFSDVQRKLLRKLGNNVLKIRDDLLKAENRDLVEVVNSYNLSGRIESAAKSLIRYAHYWSEE